jgi:hypothetical protein
MQTADNALNSDLHNALNEALNKTQGQTVIDPSLHSENAQGDIDGSLITIERPNESFEHEVASTQTPPVVEENISGSAVAPPKRGSRSTPAAGTPDDGPHQTYMMFLVITLALAVGLVMWAVAIREVLFNSNTATGGDMGAHVWTADFVARKLVGQGRITGWSDDWFAGFPVLGFYFPFPFWLMTILGTFLPYNVAFKLVTVSGLIAMPLTGFGLGHFAGLRKPLPAFCSLAALAFLMDQQYAIYGGNIKSTMAGEFSFALSMALALLFLGLISHVMKTGDKRASAGAVLAMTGLSHLLPTLWVGLAGTFIILTHLDGKRTNIRNAYGVLALCGAVAGAMAAIGQVTIGAVAAAAIALAAVAYDKKTKVLSLGQFGDALLAVTAGAALAGFWIWPFYKHLPYTNDMGYEKEQRYLWGLFPWTSNKPEASSAVFFFAFCLGVIGAIYCMGTFAAAVRRSVNGSAANGTVATTSADGTTTPRTLLTWHGWGSAFCFAGGLLSTAFFWNEVIVRRTVAAAVAGAKKPSGVGQLWNRITTELVSYTSLCRLLVFVFTVLILHVLVFAWAVDDDWQRLGVALTIVTAICGLLFRFSPYGARLWNNRVLPFWLMGTYLLAGFGVYAIGKLISRATHLNTERTFLGRHRFSAAVVAGLIVTHAAIALPLGLVPRFFPALQLSKAKTTVTKADGTTEEKKTGGWLVGIRSAGASGDFDNSQAKGWPPYNYRGYEDRGASWVDYNRIIKKMGAIGKQYGCGRTHWEYEGKQDRWGTPMALMLLPYWTDSCIQSMEGLYFESSSTAPYHWMDAGLVSKAPSNPQRDLPYKGLDLTKGISSLADFGVKYYMAFSPAALEQADKNPNLTLLGTEKYERPCDDSETKAGTCPKEWKIYQVKGSELVQELPFQPVVAKGIGQSQQSGWLDLGVAAFSDPARFKNIPFIAGEPIAPPSSWQRVKVTESRSRTNQQFGATIVFDDPKVVPLPKVNVTNIKAASLGNSKDEKPGTLSFTVDKVGVPVLVKMSYFPNFVASGAKGPYRLSDNMMVVIPTQKNVTIQYKWNKHDYLGFLAGFLGIALCLSMFIADRRRRKATKTIKIQEWRTELRRSQGLPDPDLQTV